MTDWREELIEKMAKSICDLYKLNQNDWRHWRKECRAALDVAEPVIRDLCAEDAAAIAKEHLTDAVARIVAAAIRDSRNCVPEGGKDE